MQFWQTNEFWNSIIGVLVGGGVTWLIQKLDQNHNREAQRSETLEKNKSTAKLLLNKLMRLNSNISHIGNHVEAEYAKVPESAHHEPYSFVLPLVALPEPIRFSDSETELVYSLGSADFLNKFSDLNLIHNSVIAAMYKYNSLRAELRNHMPVRSMENGVGTSELSNQQAGLAMPIMAELNSLMTHLRTNLPKDISDSSIALNEYVGEINTKFSLKIALQPR